MNKHNYHFSVVANEVGTIIAVDAKLRSGDIGYAFTRELTKEDIAAIEDEDRRAPRRRLVHISNWHMGSRVRNITQVVPIADGLRQNEHSTEQEMKATLRKLQTAIDQMGSISKSEPHLNKFHLVSGDFTTNLQAAINNGTIHSLIRARCLSRTQKELRDILGYTSRW